VEALIADGTSGAVVFENGRRSGEFLREIHLPSPVDSGRISARITRGVLEVRLPVMPAKTVTPE
jgi:HSP20 family molecular chaperone IbpA